jgi:murein L,D-transpeptidase YcbB/YkuD
MPWSATSIGECGLLEPPAAVPAAREIAPTAPIRLEAGTVDSLSLHLNIPAYRLDVVEGKRVVREIQVAVGTPAHPTPIGDFQVTSLVWNPLWIPPPFDWAKDEKATPPGPGNPTGRVKLFFGYYLFLHGTPDEASLGQAASHGCVRMRNADAIALARTVHAHASPNLPAAVLDTLEANPRRTRSIGLETPVPLAIRYDLVEVRGGRIEIHADVYGDRGAVAADVLAAIESAGLDTEDVDADELLAALRDPPPLEIPLSRVLRGDR